MKKTYLILFAAFIVASCSKELPDITPIQRDGGVVAQKSEQSPFAKYEFIFMPNTACNTSIITGQYRLFYSSCNNAPNDNSITAIKVWYREYRWTASANGLPVSPGSGWVLVQNACAVSGRSKWVKAPTTLPAGTWLSICLNGQPVNPNNDPNYIGLPSSNWELIYSNCGNGIALFWIYP
jgi:hypothetical protein